MFSIKIADTIINIDEISQSIEYYFRNYIVETSDNPYATISVSQNDIEEEKELSKNLTNQKINYTLQVINRKLSSALIPRKVVFFHGSCLSYKGNAFIFTGKSGIGKSTHAELWIKMLGDSVTIINDDKPFIRIFDNEIRAYGSPWSGKKAINTNISSPVKAICFISHGNNHITKLPQLNAYPRICSQAHTPGDKTTEVMDMCLELTSRIPVYELECDMSDRAFITSFEELTKEKYS